MRDVNFPEIFADVLNWRSLNLGSAYMGQCISVTDIADLLGWLCRICEKIRKFVLITICVLSKMKIFVYITIRALLCILKGFLMSLDIFQRHLVLIICWLQKFYNWVLSFWSSREFFMCNNRFINEILCNEDTYKISFFLCSF